MVVTLTLFSIIAGVGARLSAGLFDAYFTAQDSAPIISEGHLAMERMVREIRGARLDSAPWKDQNAIAFATADNTRQITFHQSSSGGYEIYMNQNGLEKILAQHVKAESLRFSGYSVESEQFPRLVTIEFTMSNGMHLHTAVHVRPQ